MDVIILCIQNVNVYFQSWREYIIIIFLTAKTGMGYVTIFLNFHIECITHKLPINFVHKKVQVGKDQEKAQSEKDSHSKNRGGKKPN